MNLTRRVYFSLLHSTYFFLQASLTEFFIGGEYTPSSSTTTTVRPPSRCPHVCQHSSYLFPWYRQHLPQQEPTRKPREEREYPVYIPRGRARDTEDRRCLRIFPSHYPHRQVFKFLNFYNFTDLSGASTSSTTFRPTNPIGWPQPSTRLAQQHRLRRVEAKVEAEVEAGWGKLRPSQLSWILLDDLNGGWGKVEAGWGRLRHAFWAGIQ